jgi:hypothetical protein
MNSFTRFTNSFWILLLILAVFNLARGLFHAFAPDSGAGSVAHLDLTSNATNIIFLIATIGIHQVAIALFQLLIALKARQFVVHAFVIDFIMLSLPRFYDKPPTSTFPGLIDHNIELLIVALVLVYFTLSRACVKFRS